MKISESQLRAILAAEKADALAADSASKLSADRQRAMDYYNGDMSADLPAVAGRSAAVSSDVSDTIEGMMPQLMDVFYGGNDVVAFTPVGPEDVEAAQQETDYVNHVFNQQNNGFIALYSFIKDALLSKNGIVKVWTEEEEEEARETYTDQPQESVAVLVAKPGAEVVEFSEDKETGLADITLSCKKKYKRHRVEPVPPEEFGIARRAKSIVDASYCFHETATTVGALIEQGYDEDQVKALPSAENSGDNTESNARDTVDEGASAGDEGLNEYSRPVIRTSHYIRMNYDDKPGLYRITTGGTSGDVLKRNGKLDVEEVEYAPFAAMTPIIVTHRFVGRSIADLVMDIMRIKTALIRGMLDNLYLHNNPRVEVSQSHVTDQTLDDLLVSRPGGIVRSKSPGGVNWQTVPDITTSVYPALEYFDATREWRTGVTRQAQGIDANALQNQSATAVNQAFTAAQARIRLIARIFAETGVRDLFTLLHAEIRRHGDQAQVVRLRNKWVQVDPRNWKTREDLTIDVGLGTGGKQQQLANIMALANLQKELVLGGKTNLVTDKNLYNTVKEVTKIIGKVDVESFFTDPATQPPPQPAPDPAMAKVQADMQMQQADMQMRAQEMQTKAQIDAQQLQMKAEIEKLQAQADIETNNRKVEADMALAQQKFALEKELKLIDAQLKREQMAEDMAMKRELHAASMRQAEFGVVAGIQKHEQSMEAAKAKQEKSSEG